MRDEERPFAALLRNKRRGGAVASTSSATAPPARGFDKLSHRAATTLRWLSLSKPT
ncbi:hypothetical protein [Candidatus Viridilinea mediisalina]|uniref:hypothetical protein n=1 Tax=Candidatus Viridilinea mediisalina TaxID=2024553 RepID=UPI0013FDBFEF|nr:hypothetical protein [Candidatus Viridilinea mediisalina]